MAAAPLLNQDFLRPLQRALLRTVPREADAQDQEAAWDGTMVGLHSLRPRSPLEAMLAAQIVGLHHAAMMNLADAAQPDLPPQLRAKLHHTMGTLSRAISDTVQLLVDTQSRPLPLRAKPVRVPPSVEPGLEAEPEPALEDEEEGPEAEPEESTPPAMPDTLIEDVRQDALLWGEGPPSDGPRDMEDPAIARWSG